MSVVLPGEQVHAQHVNLKLGPGLLQTKPCVDFERKTYVPAAQEPVIGVISQRQGEGYRVDIGSAHSANLDGLAFEGASKRNKPNLKVGCLVYARVSLAHKDMEPELECFDAQTHKAEGFGELKGGFLVRCSMRMCRQLLDSNHFLLPLLGAMFPLEVAIGLNGRVWVNSKEAKQIIAIVRAIEAADPDGGGLDEDGVKALLAGMDH
ncbi:hypothetical protein MPER_11234 [Moniliophthora perniciosa FA553]|nr:hypothetical protein MPER_11234 [Moniliophthora perniciosa FA553]